MLNQAEINALKVTLGKILERNEKKGKKYKLEFEGREQEHTFYGGWTQGYWEGRASALGDIFDLVEDL